MWHTVYTPRKHAQRCFYLTGSISVILQSWLSGIIQSTFFDCVLTLILHRWGEEWLVKCKGELVRHMGNLQTWKWKFALKVAWLVMFHKPRWSQTPHRHIHSVQRMSVRCGLSQYPFVNLVSKLSALEFLFSGLGGRMHRERDAQNSNAHTFPRVSQRGLRSEVAESQRQVSFQEY